VIRIERLLDLPDCLLAYTEAMESWSVGFDGDEDVERHAAMTGDSVAKPPLRIRVVSDYI
jgi:hypothetical protein